MQRTFQAQDDQISLSQYPTGFEEADVDDKIFLSNSNDYC